MDQSDIIFNNAKNILKYIEGYSDVILSELEWFKTIFMNELIRLYKCFDILKY